MGNEHAKFGNKSLQDSDKNTILCQKQWETSARSLLTGFHLFLPLWFKLLVILSHIIHERCSQRSKIIKTRINIWISARSFNVEYENYRNNPKLLWLNTMDPNLQLYAILNPIILLLCTHSIFIPFSSAVISPPTILRPCLIHGMEVFQIQISDTDVILVIH